MADAISAVHSGNAAPPPGVLIVHSGRSRSVAARLRLNSGRRELFLRPLPREPELPSRATRRVGFDGFDAAGQWLYFLRDRLPCRALATGSRRATSGASFERSVSRLPLPFR